MKPWGTHAYRIGSEEGYDVAVGEEEKDCERYRKLIEPWLSAVFQSEHLALLLGSGFTTAVASHAGARSTDMRYDFTGFPLQDKLEAAAKASAQASGRGEPNIEDRIRVATILAQGMKIADHRNHELVQAALEKILENFYVGIAATERGIRESMEKIESSVALSDGLGQNSSEPPKNSQDTLVMLVSFLLSFASRTATRERLNIFTTNYDRLIEYGADFAGLHVMDRFVGALEPVFRSSRLDVDVHYSPPGIRGEPRYLEGVVRLTKLHGSLDWNYRNGVVRRIGMPFGPLPSHHAFATGKSKSVMIYPNSAKDRETSEYPYVELFRDYAAAVCRPNSALVTYGYGFGDEHINRTIEDMLTIPSTHLVIISYGDEGGRVSSFCKRVGRHAQISLLIGPHFGSMSKLVENYLPKPAIDRISFRRAELLRNRGEYSLQDARGPKEDEETGV